MQALWILAAGLCFAVMGAFVKVGARYFSTAELVLYRSIISAFVMMAVMRQRRMGVARRGWACMRGVDPGIHSPDDVLLHDDAAAACNRRHVELHIASLHGGVCIVSRRRASETCADV